MSVKLLVVDSDPEAALKIIDSLGEGEAEVTFISHTEKAISSITKKPYDVVILGDKLIGGGDSYDVALELKKSKNRHAAIVSIGINPTRYTRIVNLLKPYCSHVNVADDASVATCVRLIQGYLSNQAGRRAGK